MNQELKEQAHKEFDELNIPGLYLSQQQKIKFFIDSLIDKTVQMERERIVGIIDENLELSCVDDRLLGQTDEYLIGYNTSTERWREKRDNVISLITNKSNINK